MNNQPIRIGDSVVCIDEEYFKEQILERNQTYVIAQSFEEEGSHNVLLAEFGSFLFPASIFRVHQRASDPEEEHRAKFALHRECWMEALEKKDSEKAAYEMGRINFWLDKYNLHRRCAMKLPVKA